MPISEDEYEYGTHQPLGHQGMSKAEQRRSNKPIMEKRRRARINNCLDELKNIILDAMNKDPARHSKLEKADILEMTVKHLQTVQRQQMTAAVQADPGVVLKFHSGFSECASEVRRYISRLDGVEPQVKQRLVSHLASCVSGLQQISPFSAPSSITTSHNSSPEDVNNNSSASARLQMMTGLQLIPSRLPTGELALLLPNSQHLPFFPAPLDNQVSTTTESPTTSVPSNPGHNSAFRAVSKDKFYSRSPLPSPTSTTASSFGDDSCDRPYPSPNLLPEVSSTSESLKSVDSSLKFNRTESQSLLQIAPPQFTNLNSNLDHHHQSRFQSTVKPIHSPLTVITSNKMLREIPQKMEKPNLSSFKNPLDFSLKKDAFTVNFPKPLKRPIQDDDSNMIKSSDFQPPLKMAKLFTENPPQNIAQSARRHFYEIQNHDPKTFQSSFEINQSTSERNCIVQNSNQPSTSSSEVPRDMWRPW